jgi:hypothetical protein
MGQQRRAVVHNEGLSLGLRQPCRQILAHVGHDALVHPVAVGETLHLGVGLTHPAEG